VIGNNLGIIEMILTGVLVLGFCLYQYIAVGREIARDKRKREASAERAGHSHGEHRLDNPRAEPPE